MKKRISGVLLTLPLMAFAQEKHVHGEAELTLAFEDKTVAIEFKSPSANLLGFESAPKNAREAEAVKAVRALLADYRNVVTLNGGNCQQSSYIIESGLEAEIVAHDDHHSHDDHKDHDHHDEHKHDDHHGDHKDHGHHDHNEHKHDDHHNHHDEHKHDQHHDDHKDHDHHKEHKEHNHHDHDDHKDHDHGAHAEEAHSDFYVSYTLSCDQVSAVSGFNVTGFNAFGGLEKVDADWVTANHQGSSELDAESTVSIEH